jgi:type I restriction enzyme R subunit
MKQSMNFEHIQTKWPQLYQLSAYAEEYAISDPQNSLVKLRFFAEQVVVYLYKELQLPDFPNSNFYDKLISHDFISLGPNLITDKLHAICKSGNKAVHKVRVDQQQAIMILQESYYE